MPAGPSAGRRPCRRVRTGSSAPSSRRPGRPTAAARMIQASACADSSAARMPSVRASVTTASSTCGVGGGGVLHPPGAAEAGVLGPDAGVVQAGRDRMRLPAPGRRRPAAPGSRSRAGCRACRRSSPRRRPPRPRPAGPRCRRSRRRCRRRWTRRRRRPPPRPARPRRSRPGALAARLGADDALELPDHPRVGVRAHHRAQAVVGVVDLRHPLPQRLAAGILQGAAAAGDRHHLGPSSSIRNTLSCWRWVSTSPM